MVWKRNRNYLTDLDWKQAALEAICEGGIKAVAVEPLARRLGVSKGSFYWHFENRDRLIEGALAHWETEEAGVFTASLDSIADPRERIRQLILRVARGSWNCALHSALSAAADHPIVRPVLQRITSRRIEYLASCYRALGFPDKLAGHRAKLGYTIYVGFIHLNREAPENTGPLQAADVRHIIDTLVPPMHDVKSQAVTAAPHRRLQHAGGG
jgi:AcrR family transcriptional regulator